MDRRPLDGMSRGNPALPNHFHFLDHIRTSEEQRLCARRHDIHAVAGPRVAFLERRVQRAFSFSVPIVGISAVYRVSPNEAHWLSRQDHDG